MTMTLRWFLTAVIAILTVACSGAPAPAATSAPAKAAATSAPGGATTGGASGTTASPAAGSGPAVASPAGAVASPGAAPAAKPAGVAASPTAAAAPAKPAAGAPAAPPKELTKIRVSEGNSLTFGQIYVAQSRGYFREEGLDVELIKVAGSAAAFTALMGGSAQFSAGTMGTISNAQLNRQDAVLFVPLANQVTPILTVNKDYADKNRLTTSMPLREKVRAMKNMKIAVTGLADISTDILKQLLREEGIDPEREVNFTATGGAQMLPALKQGAVDAFFASPPTPEVAIGDGYGIPFLNPPTGEVPQVKGMLYTGALARRDYLQQNRPIALAFARALTKAMRLIQTDREAAKAAMAENFASIEKSVFDRAFADVLPALATDPVVEPQGVELALKFLALGEERAKTLTVDRVVDTAIATEAKQSVPGR